jgi:hypothetical protein
MHRGGAMNIFEAAFCALLLGHLLTDFLFQTNAMVAAKMAGRISGYASHAGAHLVLVLLSVAAVRPAWLWDARLWIAVAGLTGVHIVADVAKIRGTAAGWFPVGAPGFLLDQALHLVTIFLAAAWYAGNTADVLAAAWNGWEAHQPRIFVIASVYVAVIFGGGYLIRYLTRGLMPETGRESSAELSNAGLYIGWLERFLVLTALLLQSPASAGLFLTAKSIARYPEFKTVRFAEYFLIGTLLSVSLALAGGILLMRFLGLTLAGFQR